MAREAAEGQQVTGVEFGPRELTYLPWSAICRFQQVRQEYPPEAIEDLVRSVGGETLQGELRPNLLNPLVVAYLDEPHAAAYLEDLNRFWGTDYQLADQARVPDGLNYAFLIAGHRRSLAIAQVVHTHQLNPQEVQVATSTRHNISFEEALALQLQENIYERPPLTDEAEAIRRYYDFMVAKGASLSKAACARRLNFSEDKVRRALAYSDLPDKVKSLVKEGALNFSLGVEIARMQQEYRTRYRRWFSEGKCNPTEEFPTPELLADYETYTFALRVYNRMHRDRAQGKRILEYVRSQINVIRQENTAKQFEFELSLGEYGPRDQRRREIARVARLGHQALHIVAREDPESLAQELAADPGYAALLQSALARARELRETSLAQQALIL